MKPAFSILLLSTLIGAAQGLFVALHAADVLGSATAEESLHALFVRGGTVSVALAVLGLAASFLHLGRPARAWRAVTMWRTSWLAREVIVLPAFICLVATWTAGQVTRAAWTPIVGALCAVAALALFVCTAMIYASLRAVPQWASAWTVAHFTLCGLACGGTAATALAAATAPALAPACGAWAITATAAAFAARAWTLVRNARLVACAAPRRGATALRHARLTQRAPGIVGPAFDARAFCPSATTMRRVRRGFLLAAFALPPGLPVRARADDARLRATLAAAHRSAASRARDAALADRLRLSWIEEWLGRGLPAASLRRSG